MKRAICAGCRQALTGAAFFAAVLGTVLVLAAGCFKEGYSALQQLDKTLLANGFHRVLLETALGSDTMALALPILSALPFTASYLDDIRSGFIKEYLPRTRMRDYIAGKVSACLLSGGLALVMGILLFYGLSALALTPLEQALPKEAERSPWLAPLMEQCLRFFCSGAFWSLVGMTMAAATGSRYMAYASPFILYYVLVILCERYFRRLYILNPKEWIAPEQAWVGGIWGVAGLLLELAALFGGWFALLARRRLERI